MDKALKTILGGISLTKDNIKVDSRRVKAGDIFFAIKGTVYDGHDYVKEVLEKGASRVLCERACPDLAKEARKKVIIVKDSREALADAARHLFNDPAKNLSVYGVTGTNGKTTTVFLIDSILNHASRSSGLVSTVFTKSSGDELKRSSMTTPDAISLNRLLREMVTCGKKAAVIEISSHALSQKRVWSIALDSAVFTNITPEHLDYHKDMEAYLRDKSKIFRNLKSGGVAALNVDDPMVIGLAHSMDFSHLVTFGMESSADVRAKDVELSAGGTSFELSMKGLGSARVDSPLIGMHNVYNMLAASAALLKSGLGLAEIKEGLEKAPLVKGRLEAVGEDAPFGVFVDYAHTPNALENVLKCLKPLAKGRLICVFGCGGDRDKTKRPLMGKIAAQISDSVIITSDNPRTENSMDILKDIEKGVLNKNNYSIIDKRQDAIQKALREAESGDIVIIAGKGHEDYQIIGREVIHFDDKEVASQVLKSLGY